MLFEETVSTSSAQTAVNVTSLVQKAVTESGMKDGHILVSVPHTTAGLTVNENADPDVFHDLLHRLEKAFPTHDRGDRHAEGNSHAHLKSSFMGTCHPFIVAEGKLLLGTWQGIYLCEFDGPRSRKLIISIPRK